MLGSGHMRPVISTCPSSRWIDCDSDHPANGLAARPSVAEPLRDKRRRHRTRWQWSKLLMALHHRKERHSKRNRHQEPEHERRIGCRFIGNSILSNGGQNMQAEEISTVNMSRSNSASRLVPNRRSHLSCAR